MTCQRSLISKYDDTLMDLFKSTVVKWGNFLLNQVERCILNDDFLWHAD